MNYAFQDVQHLYEKYLEGEFGIDAFYHLIVKVDIWRETFKDLYQNLGFTNKKILGDGESPNNEVIVFFQCYSKSVYRSSSKDC